MRDKKDKKLVKLVNKFLKDFQELAHDGGEKDDTHFNFNHTLPRIMSMCDLPMRKDHRTLLMGMSSFDDSIAKVMFNKRIQGMIKMMEERIQDCEGQEDFRVDNIEIKETEADSLKFNWHGEGVGDFKCKKVKVPAEEISFDVLNTRSGFEGKVIIKRKMDKKWVGDGDEFEEKMVTQGADFIVRGQRIMTIDYRFDYKTRTYYEEGEFIHYKYIADINSFFQTMIFDG